MGNINAIDYFETAKAITREPGAWTTVAAVLGDGGGNAVAVGRHQLAQAADHVPGAPTCVRVHAGGGFVEHQDVGVEEKGEAGADFLPGSA